MMLLEWVGGDLKNKGIGLDYYLEKYYEKMSKKVQVIKEACSYSMGKDFKIGCYMDQLCDNPSDIHPRV